MLHHPSTAQIVTNVSGMLPVRSSSERQSQLVALLTPLGVVSQWMKGCTCFEESAPVLYPCWFSNLSQLCHSMSQRGSPASLIVSSANICSREGLERPSITHRPPPNPSCESSLRQTRRRWKRSSSALPAPLKPRLFNLDPLAGQSPLWSVAQALCVHTARRSTVRLFHTSGALSGRSDASPEVCSEHKMQSFQRAPP